MEAGKVIRFDTYENMLSDIKNIISEVLAEKV